MSPLASPTSYHPPHPYWRNEQRVQWPVPYSQQQLIDLHQQQQFFEQRQQQQQQQQRYSHLMSTSHNQLTEATNRVKLEYPIVFEFIQDQQLRLEEQRREIEIANERIERLEKDLSNLWDDKKKEVDKIPPVIHVDKVQVSTASDDDTSAIDSTRKRNSENQENVQSDNRTNDIDSTFDSLPLKKRKKRQKSHPDIAKAIATLQAATSPSFSRNEKFRSFAF